MTMRKGMAIRLGALLLLSGLLSCVAEAQDAKALYEQSLVEGNSCKKMQLACQAAKIDPKKKDYSDACDRFRTSTNRSDESFRLKVADALSKNDFVKANMFSGVSFVCSAETRQALQAQIADAQKGSAPTPAAPAAPVQKADQSSSFLAEANSAFDGGKFDAAVSAAQQVTDSNLKPLAQGIINKVNSYRAAVASARQSESSKDYAGAINNWRTAQGIAANGPDSPNSNIARLEPLAHPAAPTPATPTPAAQTPVQVAKNNPPANSKQPPPPPVDTGAQAAKLMDDASKAEQANNLQAAVRAYDAVLRLQPNNTQATFNRAALLAKINSDPAEQAKSLAQAIRDFYASKYADAEDGLRAYLDAPTAKSKGAAYFYMGATRLYEKVLSGAGQKPDAAIAQADVQRPFKDARAAGYQPVERLVSPLVLRAWRSAQ